MTLENFFQFTVGIFSLLASIFTLLSITLLIWSTFRIRKLLRKMISVANKLDATAEEVYWFANRNIDYIELMKARVTSHGLAATLLSYFFSKNRSQDGKDN